MTIRQIIKRGQDTLTRMGAGKARAESRWGLDVTLSEVRLNQPLSLGELCIERVEHGLQFWVSRFPKAMLTPKGREELRALRIAMYRKERP